MEEKQAKAQDFNEFNFSVNKLGFVQGRATEIVQSGEPPADYSGPTEPPERELDLSAELVKVAERELRRQKAKIDHLPEKFFGEAAWQILLHLFVSQHRGGRASLESACRASGVSEGTCLRWLRAMQADGLLQQSSARTGQPVSHVSLTPEGYKSVRSTLLDFRELI